MAEERQKVLKLNEDQVKKFPILIKNLNKTYEDKVAVEDTCLSIGNEVNR